MTTSYALLKGFSASLVYQASEGAIVGFQFIQWLAYSGMFPVLLRTWLRTVLIQQQDRRQTRKHSNIQMSCWMSFQAKALWNRFLVHSASVPLHMQFLLHRLFFLQITVWFTFSLHSVFCSDVTLSDSAFLIT